MKVKGEVPANAWSVALSSTGAERVSVTLRHLSEPASPKVTLRMDGKAARRLARALNRGGVERNYVIESHDEAGLLRIRVGEDLVETGDSAREWVGDLSAIRPGGLFDHFRPAEKKVLRSSYRASRPRRRRAPRVLG